MSGIHAVDTEYIKPDTSFTRGHSFKLKKEKSTKIPGNNTTVTEF